MSFAQSVALQQAVYAALTTDPELSALVGSAVFDALPAGEMPPLYVQLGAENVRDASDGTGAGAEHRFTLSVVSKDAGFADAKTVASLICDRLQDAELTLSRGRLISLRFERASARVVLSAQARQIDMQFRARVQDN